MYGEKQRGMFLDHLRMVYFSTNAARVVELEVVSSYTVVALEQSRPLSQAGTSKAEAAGSVPLKVIKSSRWVAWDALQGAVEVAQNELRKPPMVEAKSKRLQVTPLMTSVPLNLFPFGGRGQNGFNTGQGVLWHT